MGAPSVPVSRSIGCALRSPHHSEVMKLAAYTKLSPAIGSRLLTAAEAAAPSIASILSNASFKPVTTDAGSLALRYLPRPFTAACHRSSAVVGSSADGTGQFFV